MRKFMNIFAAALVMLAAASCEKNEVLPDNNSEGKVVTLKASINNGETKASLGNKSGETYPVLWSEGDEIAVAQVVGSDIRVYKFTLTAGKGTQNGTFTCEDATGFDPSSEATIARYPYTTQLNFYVVQTNQNYAEKSFDSDAILMGAFMEEGSLKFNNILGILKLTIKGASDETVSSIELTANKPISGNAKFNDTGDGLFIITNGTDADYKNNIVLNCPDVEIATAKEFLITVPAGTYDFAVTINTNKGTYYKSTTNKSITESMILNMPPLDLTDFENSMPYVENGVYLGEGIALPAGEGNFIIWAPVNCGYDANHRYGLLYQWGRKYGQGYADETPTTNVETLDDRISYIDGSLEDNKYNFYSIWAVWAQEWDNASKISVNLWNNVPGKTDYDPCPSGWRVPTIDELVSLVNGLSVDSNKGGLSSQWTDKSDDSNHIDLPGFWFYGNTTATTGNSVFFPAAGSRWFGTLGDGTTGVAIDRGRNGSYWSSSLDPSSSYFVYAWYFSGSSGSVSSDQSYPAPGMSVRCVKVETQPVSSSN